MNPFFVDQVRIYSTYHRDPRNRATHFVGIPLIVFSLFIPLSWVELFAAGRLTVTLAVAVFVASSIYYLWLDRPIGVAMVAAVSPLLLFGAWVAERSADAWTVFAVCFVGGWALQFLGHYFEGRRPALMDNLLQALIGPVFLVAEVFLALGWRDELGRALERELRDLAAARQI